ncbi:MAG TPA: MerR family transcriptional regulator [Micromonosporaceae bacterium]|nr:MerR family transcriptional regulator [Micromonosporaceae bacterium]
MQTRWSTAQLARMSKVTSRTLRHYDRIGLLRPAAVAHNGLRYYEREQLLRLQQILVLRELGLPLESIRNIVNEGGDRLSQLRRHHQWLLEERDRFDRLAATVAATIRELEGGESMRPEELFENFDADKQARYEAELVERYGDEVTPHVEESKRRISGLTKARADQLMEQWRQFGPHLVQLIDAGKAPADPDVQERIAEHYEWVCQFWTPNREAYIGLGDLYVNSPDFKSQFDAQHPQLAEFLRDAMTAYANARL